MYPSGFHASQARGGNCARPGHPRARIQLARDKAGGASRAGRARGVVGQFSADDPRRAAPRGLPPNRRNWVRPPEVAASRFVRLRRVAGVQFRARIRRDSRTFRTKRCYLSGGWEGACEPSKFGWSEKRLPKVAYKYKIVDVYAK